MSKRKEMVIEDRPFYDPKPPEFVDLNLPKIKGIEFVDCSTELDEPLGNKKVIELALGIGETGGTKVYGTTLREIIKNRAAIPLIGGLVMSYSVYDNGNSGRSKDYFINGEIIATPEEAEERGIQRLATVMRTINLFKGKPGIFVPLIPPQLDNQQIVFAPDINRVVQISLFGKEIGPAVGIKLKP